MNARPAASNPWLAASLTAIPWLNPFTFGPMSGAVPWMVSFACTLLLWLLARHSDPRVHWGIAAATALSVLWTAVVHHAGSEAFYLGAGLVLMVIAAALPSRPSVADGIQRGLLIAAALNALIGLGQYFAVAPHLQPWVFAGNAGEAFGNLRQPNQYVSLCWMGVALLLFGRPKFSQNISLSLAVLLAVAAAASTSRTGLLQGLLVLVLAVAWPGDARRRRLLLCITALAAYFCAAALLPLLLQTLTGELPARTLWSRFGAGDSCSSRAVLWSNVLHLIAQKPFVGWGWGELDYAHFATLYPGARFCDILDNAHNLPLHLAVELGVPAAVLISAFVIGWMVRQRPWAERDQQRQCAWALLLLLLLHSMLEYPMWYGPFQLVLGASIGWLRTDASTSSVLRFPRLSTAVATLLLVATAYAGWDYVRVSQAYLQPEQRLSRWREAPVSQASGSWLFANQVAFAELTTTELTRANATWMYEASKKMLHYSPEPRVVERAVESASLVGKESEALLQLARFRAAFPREYEAWRNNAALPRQD